MVAVQCKHYSEAHTVTKAEVDSFLSESARDQFVERLLIATTSRLAEGARQVIAAQEKPVTLILRDRLEQAEVDWEGFGSEESDVLVPKGPLPHQERAIADVVRRLKTESRGRLLMPCGTGKTLTCLWIAEGLGAERTLILVPTLALVRQTVGVWRAEADEPLALLKVCSEQTTDEDELAQADLDVEEVGQPTTTDPAEIAEFLSGPGRRVIISTYQSSPTIASALEHLSDCGFDLAICDEAHHCAGLEGGAHKTILDEERIAARRRLFATATPTVFSVSARQQAAHAHAKVASMDAREHFGPVLHRLSFKRATEEGLLCPYQVLVMPVRDSEVAELVRRRGLVTPDGGDHVTDAYTLAAQIACLRTMRRYGCQRLVAFQPRVPESRCFAADLEQAMDLLREEDRPASLHAAHIDGYMAKHRREQILGHFSNGEEPQLLSNVRLLAEGVDVPGIDAICLVDTNRRPASVVQAVGRVVRTAPGKSVGTVLLPVLVEEGESVEDALKHSRHRSVMQVLAALRSIDDEIVNTVDAIRVELGPQRGSSEASSSWVVDAPAEVGADFADAIEVGLVDVLDAQTSDEEQGGRSAIRGFEIDENGSIYGEVDWDGTEIVDVGLEWADQHRLTRIGPIDTTRSYMGFPFERWWKEILRRWEKGRIDDEHKQRIASRFTWLSVPSDCPRARREMAERDPRDLDEQLDEWLYAWAPLRGDDGLDELARAGVLGGREGIPSAIVLEFIPETVALEQRVQVALEMLKIGGRAVHDAVDGREVHSAFCAAVREPGRSHGLDVELKRGRKPKGQLESYAFGWEEGQRAVRLAERRLRGHGSPASSRKNGRRRQSGGRR